MEHSVPILMYHQVSTDVPTAFREYVVTPRAFARQMWLLSVAGYSTITVDELLDARAGLRRLPRRPVVITFDDGYCDSVQHAVPVLKKYGFTATFFLVAGLAGLTSQWLRDELGVEFQLINWDVARQLESEGFECGAHTVTHPRLAEISSADCRTELHDARVILEDRLQREVRHLAYPFGSYDGGVQRIAIECGYRSACSVRIGLSVEDDDPFALHRVNVSGRDSLVDFAVRLRTANSIRQLRQNRTANLRRAVTSAFRSGA